MLFEEMFAYWALLAFWTLLAALVWIKKRSAFNGLQFFIPFLGLLSESTKSKWSIVLSLLTLILAGIQLWILIKEIDKLIIKKIATLAGLIILLNSVTFASIMFGLGSFSLSRFRK